MHEIMRHPDVVILVFAGVFGMSAALLGWLISASVAATPPEDRRYKDPLPLGFRVTWICVLWISRCIAPLLSQQRLAALEGKLRKAGLEYTLGPAQFVAGRLLCMLLVIAVFWWLAGSFRLHAAPAGAGHGAGRYLLAGLVGALAGWTYPAIWLKDRIARSKSEMQKTLPFYLDIITLCVEAGLNFQGALKQAVEKGPKGILRDEFVRVLRDIRAGSGRATSLRAMSERLQEPGITNFISAVIQAENMGINLGPVLRAQADQRRTERFLRAEKLAMEAPVKLLFPLIAFIFPCTFIVLFFPLAMKFMQSGL